MEQQRLPHAQLVRWAAAAPLMQQLWQRHRPARGDAGAALPAWVETLVAELVGAGALRLEGGEVFDR
jgi:hypothetical protein